MLLNQIAYSQFVKRSWSAEKSLHSTSFYEQIGIGLWEMNCPSKRKSSYHKQCAIWLMNKLQQNKITTEFIQSYVEKNYYLR